MYTISPFAYYMLLSICVFMLIYDLITQNWTAALMLVGFYILGRIVGRL